MLLRIAQGDAYAAAVEYCKRTEHAELFEEVLKFERYHKHPTHHKLNAGMYTDDTQMSIAVSESLLQGPRRACVVFAQAFFEAFKRDQRDGYSRKFQEILEKSTSWQNMLELLQPDSNKNGAAMRSVPLGVLGDPATVMQVAQKCAIITHNTSGGVLSSQAVGLMSHFALHTSQSFADLPGYVAHYLPELNFLSEPWRGGVGLQHSDPHGRGIGINTVHAVMTLLIEQPSLMDILRQTIEWRGDTDSVGAIAWGIASTRYPNEIIPDFMEYGLEAQGNLKYGPQFLLKLGDQLMKRYDA
jgi:ADP-ribosylglycohydrolase